jgi:hypothetical protein
MVRLARRQTALIRNSAIAMLIRANGSRGAPTRLIGPQRVHRACRKRQQSADSSRRKLGARERCDERQHAKGEGDDPEARNNGFSIG